MILITGGAGFIGSNLHAALAARGLETVIVDHLGRDEKWRNLAKHPPARLLPPETLDDFLATHPPLEVVVHLGAISDTTARDADRAWAVNVELSLALWRWCAARGARFIYASSAATYGGGEHGFTDTPTVEALAELRPLNLYGWTKHAFDLRVARIVADGGARPPQWVGLKFFNVYGPNEYHKGGMISVVKVKFDEVSSGLAPRLFRSATPGVADGEQRRDFIWIGDVVAVIEWLLDHPSVNGLFNVGTGAARTYRDVARAVTAAAGAEDRVEFIEMPLALRGQYQHFTQARVERLRGAGFAAPFTPLEVGVRLYVDDFLATQDRYR